MTAARSPSSTAVVGKPAAASIAASDATGAARVGGAEPVRGAAMPTADTGDAASKSERAGDGLPPAGTAAPHRYLPARYYALLGVWLAAQGVDVPALMRDAGVPLEVLAAPDGQLTPEQVERLAALGRERTGRSDLGFELGRLLKLSSHDILGYALLSAPTLDAALRLVARYFGLITPTYAMRYRVEGEHAEARFTPTLALSPPVLELHLEAIAVAFSLQVRALLLGGAGSAAGTGKHGAHGGLHGVTDVEPFACAIHFSHAAPAHAARYARELPGVTAYFGEAGLPGARVVLPRALLGRTLAMADAHALQMAEARCAALLAGITGSGSLAEWARMMLAQAADGTGPHALGELAAILNLSPRTFERRLAAEGVHFRSLAGEARHARACALLSAGRLSVTQVAYQLGYGDVANFTRAFRKLAGVAPSRYGKGTG